MTASRRRFLATLGLTSVALALDRQLSSQPVTSPAGGRLVKSMPLGRLDGRPTPPLHRLLGSGLDARQFTDLGALTTGQMVTAVDRFFVRTSQPPALPPVATWELALGSRATSLGLETLLTRAGLMGTHLMECSGNADPANFGLISAATWTGVPMAAIIDRLPRTPEGSRIRVTGVDDDTRPTASSLPGASWIFTRDELERSGAFIATHMNGAVLTPDHGGPIRLVVPNYYGCSCIKWVSRVDVVPDDEPATAQMKEFAARTHQNGVPARASDYEPPVIDLAATPIRVEQWLVQDRVIYRVVGIRWGGRSQRAPLTIRFKHTERFVPVDDCPDADSPTTWSLWSHTWRPEATGRYQIALNVADRSIRTRRLDLFYYTRDVDIDRI